MTATGSVLVAAAILQCAAAVLAVRLIWVTGKKLAWGLVATAILLMVARRGVQVMRAVYGDPAFAPDLTFELIGLVISACMLIGIAGIGPLFGSIRGSQQSLRDSEERLRHLNAVLLAIRNVNQLITLERQRDRLLQRICESLIESRGYRHAWIVLLDSGDRASEVAEAGLGPAFVPLRERLAVGELPACVRHALAEPGVAVIGQQAQDCHDCPLCQPFGDGQVMAVRLSGGDERYGVMVASLPAGFAVDGQERDLFAEAAGDIAMALRSIRLDDERRRAEKSLRLDERRLESLLQLSQMTDASLREITDFTLEQAVQLTESQIGYLAFLNEDESILTMHSWSQTAMEECAIVDKPLLYPVVTTGLWGEAVRQRQPVITNDYPAPNPLKKGCPEGHVPILRHMNVPVFDGGRIVAVAGVGNKEDRYDDSDVRQLTLLMQGMWRLLQRRSAEEELRRTRDDLEIRVHERTAELANANDDLKVERYLLHSLMDNLPHNIYFKDAQSRFIRINRAMAAYIGLGTPEEAVGKSDLDFFTDEHAQQAMADERRIVETGRPVLDKEEKETWPDGRCTWATTTKMPLYDDDGNIVGTFGISRDITEKKLADVALHAAKEAAEAASRAKSAFLANMSHEIRTPLNAIIGMTELVLKSQLSNQQREFLGTVRDSGEALLSVINDILDFSKIEAGKLVLGRAPFNLWESLGDTMKSFALRAHQKGLELACYIHPQVPHMVVGDYGRLRQVVVNLVGNALKFTDHGEVFVEVRLENHGEEDVVLHFTVCDTGIGIPAEKRAAIFGVFEQADTSMTRRHGGTGLGLAIASRLVELMGGTIWLESDVGRGSQFHFTVRLGLAAELPPRPEPAEIPILDGMKVLVVDDNATNRRILEEVLQSWQMAPALVSSAPDAIALMHDAQAAGEPFRLVVTDAHMPGVDGFTLAEHIRQHAGEGGPVIMMLTSGDRPEDMSRCEQLDIAAYLLKPIKQSELLDAIELALGIASVQPETPAAAEHARRVGPLRILLAEDSLVNQKLAVALLEGQGHAVTVVGTGREALDTLAAQPFDLVLMDVQMPEMDGLEATGQIRAQERHTGGHVPIIALTAHALSGDRDRCLEAGTDGYIAKPIRAGELFEAIDDLLAGARMAEPPADGVIDWSQALEAAQGNADLVDAMVDAALEEIPRLMADLRQAVAAGEKTRLRLVAHTIKGSLRYFGAERALEHAFDLETMGKEGRTERAAAVLAMLETEMASVTTALANHQQRS